MARAVKWKWLPELCVFAFVLVGCLHVLAQRSLSQTHPMPQEKLLEGAKREGKMVWYSSLNINDSKALLDRFEQKYPFVKTELLRAGAEQLLNRILNENRAGRHLFDAVNLTSITALKKTGLLQPHRSREGSAYPNQFRDSDGYWVTLYNLYTVIGYNTKLVSQGEAPKDWHDLLDPKWRGKIGMDQEEYEWYAGMLDYWGEQRARKFMRALSGQKIHWRKGHTLIAQLMAAGEFSVGLVYAHRIESMKRAGAPVEWVKSSDPITVTLAPIGVAAKASHPNTAKLFMDFTLSREAQAMLQKVNRISGRQDIEPIVPEMHPGKLRLVAIHPGVAEELARYSKEFQDIFSR
jgi:iron(III) transport system substrate-binding protein